MTQHSDNPYPVDSATRECCGAIGGHAPDCENADPLDWHGQHRTWCTNRDDAFPIHTDEDPYCSKQIGSTALIPEGGTKKASIWVSATGAFTHGQFTAAEAAARERKYNGVEIAVETWQSGQWGEHRLRITSDCARTLAALLVRGADIEQGLDR